MSSLTVPDRFNGPARSANGGWVSGALAALVPGADGRPVEVTLRQPPPLATSMAVGTADGTTTLSFGGSTLATARVVDDDLEPVDARHPDEAARAMLAYPGLSGHPFPTCFVCGPDRDEGDGLRIFPGPVDGDRGHVASLWVPDPSLAAADAPGGSEGAGESDELPHVAVATAWAALDCVGGWSEDLEGRPCVLGRMTARVDALPVVGEPHVAVGRHLGVEGRKSFTASTLYDADGRVVASARHVWLQVDPGLFN